MCVVRVRVRVLCVLCVYVCCACACMCVCAYSVQNEPIHVPVHVCLPSTWLHYHGHSNISFVKLQVFFLTFALSNYVEDMMLQCLCSACAI